MKRVLLAACLGLGVLTFTFAGSANHATAPHNVMINDTVPEDTTQPAPEPDTTSVTPQ